MKVPGSARFWNFGAFPVLAAAAFQVAIIMQASDALGLFFFIQSIIAIGLSIACLQPRTWSSELRSPSRLRWSLLFSVALLVAAGAYFAVVPTSLGLVVGAFVAKKTCDVGREFVFLSDVKLPVSLTAIVTAMEIIGIVLLLLGWLPAVTGIYLAAGFLLIGRALWSVRSHPWSVSWVLSELPHALSMTLFNMGSRVFLVSISTPAAHLTIGSILQVANFLSPVTYSLYSRSRLVFIYIAGWLLCASIIFVGGQAFIWLGGSQGTGIAFMAAFSALLAFNSSAIVRLSADATRRVRTWMGIVISSWAVFGALLAFSELLRWETSFALYLVGNASILIYFALAGIRSTPLLASLAKRGLLVRFWRR